MQGANADDTKVRVALLIGLGLNDVNGAIFEWGCASSVANGLEKYWAGVV